MSDLTDKLKNAKEKIVEVGAKAKDSKAAEAMAKIDDKRMAYSINTA